MAACLSKPAAKYWSRKRGQGWHWLGTFCSASVVASYYIARMALASGISITTLFLKFHKEYRKREELFWKGECTWGNYAWKSKFLHCVWHWNTQNAYPIHTWMFDPAVLKYDKLFVLKFLYIWDAAWENPGKNTDPESRRTTKTAGWHIKKHKISHFFFIYLNFTVCKRFSKLCLKNVVY